MQGVQVPNGKDWVAGERAEPSGTASWGLLLCQDGCMEDKTPAAEPSATPLQPPKREVKTGKKTHFERTSRWLVFTGGGAAGMVGAVLGIATWELRLQDWNLPDWLLRNSGPWIAFGALVAFTGVTMATIAQARVARFDRNSARCLAEEERDAQEARAQREWFREKQFEAYNTLIVVVTALEKAVRLRRPGLDELFTSFDEQVQKTLGLTPVHVSLMLNQSVASVDDDLTKSIYDDASESLLKLRKYMVGQIRSLNGNSDGSGHVD